MAIRIQLRRDTAANWVSSNPVLRQGEIGIETDTLQMKLGNGTSTWTQITAYMNLVPDGNLTIGDYVMVNDIGASLGVVGLDNNKNALIPGSSIIVEGATDNSFETTLTVIDPTADRTITFKNADGTVAFTTDIPTTTDALTEGSTNKYFSDEQAQDAVANSLAAGTHTNITVTYNDAANSLSLAAAPGYVDEQAVDAVAAALAAGTHTNISVSYNDAGNAISLTGAQTYNDENAQDAIGNNLGTGLSYNDTTGAISVDSTIATKAYADTAISNLVASSPATLDTLNELATALGNDASFSTTVTNSIATKAPIASPTFTGTVSGITKTMVGLGNVDNTSDVSKPISTATQTALDLKASSASPTFTGTATLGGTGDFVINGTSNIRITPAAGSNAYIGTAAADNIVTTAGNTQTLTNKSLTSPTLTGTPTAPTAATATNTTQIATTAFVRGEVTALVNGASAALDTLGELAAALTADEATAATLATLVGTKAPIASPTFTGTVSGITKTMVGLGNVDNTTDAAKPISTATQTALDLKANLASPTFTGTVSGITATMVGLGNVDNTSDANKPVSTATQTALDLKLASTTAATTYETITNVALKAPLASPTFTGTVSGITATMVGLGNVDNTSDANKPVSTATQTALDLKATLASPALTGIPTAPTAISSTNTTQVATTAYVKSVVSDLTNGAGAAYDTLKELQDLMVADDTASAALTTLVGTKAPIASPTFTGTVSGIDKTMVGLGNVDNTSDANKPVSTATQTALDLKAPLANPTFTGTVSGITKTMVGLGNVDNTTDAAKPISTATQTALDLKLASATAASTYAPIANPTFTGTATLGGTGDFVINGVSNIRITPAAGSDAYIGSLTSSNVITTAGNTQTLTNKTLTSPVLTTPALGTPSSGVMTNVTGLPLTTGVTGTLPISNGGTNITTYASGDILYASATNTLSKLVKGTDGQILTLASGIPSWAAAPITLPSQTGNSGYYLTTNGTSASWGALVVPITTGTATVNQNTAQDVDTTALSAFTSIEYMVSIKQGSKTRTSKVILQTDGTSVDMTEFAITETGGTLAGVVVSATTASSNGKLQVTVTDALSTNATVKFSKIAL